MGNKTLNFDRCISEMKRETITVTVKDKEYVIPCAIPAIVPVMMARSEAALDSALKTNMIFRAGDAMFGKANIDQMCADGLIADDLARLIDMIFRMVQGNESEEDLSQELDDESGYRKVKQEKK